MKKILLISLLFLTSCVTKEVPVEKVYGIITKVEIIRPETKRDRTPYTLYTVTFGQETKEFKVWFEQYDKKVGDEWLYYKPLK